MRQVDAGKQSHLGVYKGSDNTGSCLTGDGRLATAGSSYHSCQRDKGRRQWDEIPLGSLHVESEATVSVSLKETLQPLPLRQRGRIEMRHLCPFSCLPRPCPRSQVTGEAYRRQPHWAHSLQHRAEQGRRKRDLRAKGLSRDSGGGARKFPTRSDI